MKKEERLQLALSDYIRMQYKGVLFNVDMSGIKLTIGQAVKLKKLRSGRSFPDMSILQPNRIYHGMFIELKSKSPYKKDGVTLLKNEHIQEQQEMLKLLNRKGYYSLFVWTFEQGKKEIDWYLSMK